MKRAVAEKLDGLANEAGKITEEYEYLQWANRTKMLIEATLGADAAANFDSIDSGHWPLALAMRRGRLEGLVLNALEERAAPSELSKDSARADGRKVFVVHGHDEAAKDGVARFIDKVGLSPIILHEQANAGRTIIEKFEMHSREAVFAVVLLTPDDLGRRFGTTPPSQEKPRARQNVIMELGYFIGTLGRKRVCALYKGNVELPSDYQGVLYVEMDSAGAWKQKLAQELVESKIPIDLHGILGS